ncbi:MULTISPECIES: anaerobic ribonucleoside-triphosphate reductase activating protein [Alteromonadales]|uniref:Anaerobic ribonucleoside-triphosphate reductase activating protein n=1 Tax=Pseudidiomarina taiwanensis TaxID=337250 RepID=A0A432ZF53_9GAMM|nr:MULTISPECIES: anaerobic ribonucleoside-triphosphate reductase activating protein [Alteromonadales]RUO76534.1 anaerobic ribonucleoside-triphosphate reductase activating protein [Pseudidiomarina taiwanensis]
MQPLFNSLEPQVLFQEVPDEVSLGFTITGCKLRCERCHSQDIWDSNLGAPLTNELFATYLDKYEGFITCVLFFGGEWHAEALREKLLIARQTQLKTCLYTGLPRVSPKIQELLSFLKTGKWVFSLGGLDSPSTNQKLINVYTGESLNHKFWENTCANT